MQRKFVWTAWLFAFAAVTAAAQITIPNTFVNGTVADATQVNANFNAVGAGALNRTGGTMTGTLTAQNIAASADATYDVGTASVKFRDGFFSRNVTIGGNATITGSLTLGSLASTLGVASGGTGLASGTSGGVLYFSGSTTLASSAALAANAVVVGGGAGVTPATNAGFTINSSSFLSSSTQARGVFTNSAVQSIPDSTGTVLTFDTEEVDVGATHSTSSNTGRFTVPTGGDGFYCFFGYMSWAGAATNQRQFSLRKNGTTTYVLDNRSGSASINVSHAITSCHALVATDYMELIAFQDSGAPINTGTNTRFIGVKFW